MQAAAQQALRVLSCWRASAGRKSTCLTAWRRRSVPMMQHGVTQIVRTTSVSQKQASWCWRNWGQRSACVSWGRRCCGASNGRQSRAVRRFGRNRRIWTLSAGATPSCAPCTAPIAAAQSQCIVQSAMLVALHAPFSFCHLVHVDWIECAAQYRLAGCDKACVLQIIQRDRLVACLYEHIQQHYSAQVTVQHHVKIDAASECSTSSLRLHCCDMNSEDSWILESPFVVRSTRMGPYNNTP
jgi:hypothetical protein